MKHLTHKTQKNDLKIQEIENRKLKERLDLRRLFSKAVLIFIGILIISNPLFSQCSNFNSATLSLNSGTYNSTNPIPVIGGNLNDIHQLIEVGTNQRCIIEGLTLKFGSDQNFGAKIIIRKGGSLLIRNSNLLSCGSGWNGIVLEGDNMKSQKDATGQNLNSNQGILTIENTIISDALIGVEVGSYSNNSVNGGIFIVNNSKFYNCQQSIVIHTYSDPQYNTYLDHFSPTKITNCRFEWNQHYIQAYHTTNLASLWGFRIFDKPFYYHISLENVQGISFISNVFINSCRVSPYWLPIRSGDFNTKNRGIGIHAENSTFLIQRAGPCYSDNLADQQGCVPCHGVSNHFEGFWMGIEIISNTLADATNRYVDIIGAVFLNNIQGIRIAGDQNMLIKNINILNNTFLLSGNEIYSKNEVSKMNYYGLFDYTLFPALYTTGICLESINDIHIEGNIFNYRWDNEPLVPFGSCPGNGDDYRYFTGIMMFNYGSGIGFKSIKKNTFDFDLSLQNSCSVSLSGICLYNTPQNIDISCNKFSLQRTICYNGAYNLNTVAADINFEQCEGSVLLGSSNRGLKNKFSIVNQNTCDPPKPLPDQFNIYFGNVEPTTPIAYNFHLDYNYYSNNANVYNPLSIGYNIFGLPDISTFSLLPVSNCEDCESTPSNRYCNYFPSSGCINCSSLITSIEPYDILSPGSIDNPISVLISPNPSTGLTTGTVSLNVPCDKIYYKVVDPITGQDKITKTEVFPTLGDRTNFQFSFNTADWNEGYYWVIVYDCNGYVLYSVIVHHV